MKDWERIRKGRTDVTDYVIHWTKSKIEDDKYKKPLDVLLDIVKCGYIAVGFSLKTSIYDRSKRPTIRGPHPAACFTEQSLEQFTQSCRILPSHYRPYGIGLYKRALFEYGGRPVIYSSEEILGQIIVPNEKEYEQGKEIYKNGLHKEFQYLWVRYQPIPNVDGYVVDWTHEREWRCRIMSYHDIQWGFTPSQGIPIVLPAVFDYSISKNKPIRYLPKILVKTLEERDELAERINEKLPEWADTCQHPYLQGYFELLPDVKIIALDELSNHPEEIELEWVISK